MSTKSLTISRPGTDGLSGPEPEDTDFCRVEIGWKKSFGAGRFLDTGVERIEFGSAIIVKQDNYMVLHHYESIHTSRNPIGLEWNLFIALCHKRD